MISSSSSYVFIGITLGIGMIGKVSNLVHGRALKDISAI